ncbi:MAG TPA: hypothetical protein VF507_00100, partial [Pyrinomonadaceae bacterium]
NEVHGDLFAYFTTKSFVRATKNLPFTGSAFNGFSEQDVGGDIGGPIVKNKLWFFGAFNPQMRKNYYLTQTFRTTASNKVRTPFYAGKLTFAPNNKNTITFSTFGDFTKIEGFLATGALTNVSGFGSDIAAFQGTQKTGGHNYALRLNSTITPTWIMELNGALHYQRANTIPQATDQPLISNTFTILAANGTIAPTTQTGITLVPAAGAANTTGELDYIYAPGTLQRGFLVGPGFGLFSNQNRNRRELTARFQNIYGRHTIKYGTELFRNDYKIATVSTGPNRTFPTAIPGLSFATADNNVTQGYRVTNNFSVCAVRGSQIVCPSGAAQRIASQIVAAGRGPAGLTVAPTGTITTAEALNSPFLVRTSTRIRDFQLHADTHTNVESFYIQDDFKLSRSVNFNFGLRWDYQQAYGNQGETYLKLNNFKDNLQPRLGLVWDPSGQGKGKIFVNFARFVETPIPLDVNVRAGSENSQIDKNFNVSTYSGFGNAAIVPGIRASTTVGAVNLGSEPTPIDPDLRPQSVNEVSAGVEYEVVKDLTLGFRGLYRTQGSVIEDGSFDDGDTYFLFNPGESLTDRLAEQTIGQRFGRARRYYRAVEFTATKRFTKNYQFIASYVFSSLIGNYEGLFRNDNGQSDPNITSLFDLVSLLANSYGRLPNDRPHQFKFNGSYQTPWKLVVSANFYAQSGAPFNQLVPHPVYGNNEGFGVPRGTAVVPNTGASITNGSAGVENAVGKRRSPLTTNLDLGGYIPIKLGENRQLRFTIDWFNVFNQQRAVTLDQTFQINSGVTGVPPITNPFYGSGLIFQFPSSLRLGAKFQF